MHVRYAGVIAVLVLGAAACGSSSSKGSGATNSSSNTSSSANPYASPSTTAAPATTAPASGASAAPVKIAKVKGDTLMVDTANGKTVYAFSPDTATTSACNTNCDTLWPPVTATGTVPATVQGIKLTTLTRSDGTKQVVANGHPVYTFSGDTAPGQTNGEGVAGKWYYVNEKGEPDKG
jgi:predicted lipoprotein with Yx(FWY)xxD motif